MRYTSKAHQTFKNATTIDEALKHQLIETIEDTYIIKSRQKIQMVHGSQENRSITPSHRKICQNYRNVPQGKMKIFDEALDTTTPIDKYFE